VQGFDRRPVLQFHVNSRPAEYPDSPRVCADCKQTRCRVIREGRRVEESVQTAKIFDLPFSYVYKFTRKIASVRMFERKHCAQPKSEAEADAAHDVKLVLNQVRLGI
jgi:hypothetical protein